MDDSNDKIANVIKTIRLVSEKIKVQVVVDFISAQSSLIQTKYDLLILDLNLPVRQGEIARIEIGKNLLNEINRKQNINSPNYIISLTQYIEESQNISDIWITLHYTADQDAWKQTITNLIKHILKSKNYNDSNLELLKPTIFFEGKTDERIFLEAINIYKPQLLDQITLKSDTGAGANWVARQTIAWAHALHKDKKQENSYLKAIALLDNDGSGKIAQDEINRVIKIESAESNTFKIFKLSTKYARHIISYKQKGIDLQVCLEEMFPIEYWKIANKNNWLTANINIDRFLTDPKKWNKMETSLKEYISSLGFNNDEMLYLNSFKNEYKGAFVDLICKLDNQEKATALHCFKELINDCENYLLNSRKGN
ncbi:hypothetical protein [Mucilaginibacter sp. NFR10]|uniref:hypothetical protein n=1 Tax=Mucilaginibacter sp. NFR10 TaxID=1566292 RepID=UPI0015875DC1|nr:hypothetical protein [Mucilaginibacter sp. NFR10]